MLLRKEASPCSLTGLKQLLGTAVLYFLLLMFLNLFIVTTTGAELRFATVVPVVAGLLFGLPAALGSFVGNFAAGLFTGYGPLPNFTASFLNFLLAYTSYRVWYGWQSKKATLYVYNNRTFVKFIGSNLFAGASFALVWSAFQEAYFGNTSWGITMITFVNNFAFPVLLGLPVLLLWDKYVGTEYYRPQEQPRRWQALCRPAFGLTVALDVLSLCFLYCGYSSRELALGLGVCGILSWLYAIQLPSEYTTHPEETDGFQSLVSGMAIRLFSGVILLIVLFLLLSSYLKGYDLAGWQQLDHWLELGRDLLICLTVLIIGAYYVLRNLESTMTQRLKMLSYRVKDYLETRDLSQLQAEAGTAAAGQQNEIDVLEQALQSMSDNITTYLMDLDKTVAEQESMNTQLSVANSIQHGVLPKLEQLRESLPGYRIDGGMQAAKVIGGDMYDAFKVDEDHLVISIADVSGKGIPAALFAMVTQALLRQNARSFPPALALALTNDALGLHNEQCLFVTVWLAVVELSTGHLTYINAGHNPPLLQLPGADKAIWLEELSGPVLGLMPELSYEAYEAQLPPGARLLLYTDGFNEAENNEHEFFGNERLEQSFLGAADPRQLLQQVADFVQDAEPSDDMTYLWLEREEAGK